MKLVVLGSTGYHPNDRRQTACFMIPELGIVLDAGTGMYRVGDWLATSELDIFLTHAHLDHVVGLTFLFDVFRDRQMDRVDVFGEAEKIAAIRKHLLHPLIFPVHPPCKLHNLPAKVPLRGGGMLTHFPLCHPGGSIGLRLDWPDRSLAYVTDTTASLNATYLDSIRGVDLLLHECYFPDNEQEMALKTGHSCTTAVAEVAREAGVKRLVLVHLLPLSNELDPVGLDVARSIFPNTELGTDRLELEF
jgi:ribonuclease Z